MPLHIDVVLMDALSCMHAGSWSKLLFRKSNTLKRLMLISGLNRFFFTAKVGTVSVATRNVIVVISGCDILLH